MSTMTARHRSVKPTRTAEPFAAGLEVDTCPLPTIYGAGLSFDEYCRVNGPRNIARSIYAADCPEASPGELDRVGDAAARDALRAVLRDRPAALALPAPEPCCGPDEDDDGEYADASEWPAWTDERWTTTEDPEPEPAPVPLAVPLDRYISIQADRFRGSGTRLGDLLARTLDGLASTARSARARTPHDLEFHVRAQDLDDAGDRLEPEPELMPSGQWA